MYSSPFPFAADFLKMVVRAGDEVIVVFCLILLP